MTRNLFVTTALPYANGPFHIGHIMEYIQADIWVRFQRMQGCVVHFVGADDAHGAPIMLKAEARASLRRNWSGASLGTGPGTCKASISTSIIGIRRNRRRTSRFPRTSTAG